MENLNTQIVVATEQYLKSDKLKDVIEQQAEKMVNDAVSEAFRWSGNIRKQIDDVVKNQLSINVKELGIEGQNTFITEIVTKKLKKVVQLEVAEKIGENIDSILRPTEKVITIETLEKELLKASTLEEYEIESAIEDGYASDYFTLIVEESDHEWFNVYFDKEPDRSSHNCTYKLTVHKNFTSFKINDEDLKAIDKLADPYKWDIEDFVYQMFLNESTIDYESVKGCA